MAFFKFRKGGDEQAATAQQPESIEALRKRARHRLIGAAVLVLAGVIGFPLLVDKQPRPVAVDIPIEIPDKAKVKPLAVAPAPQAAASGESAAAPVAPLAAAAPQASEAPAAVASGEARPAKAATEPKTSMASEAKPAVESKPAAKPADEGTRAQALLDGKAASAEQPAAKAGRFVVQVGAFAEASKAREVRLKVERAGVKTYTHVAETKDGQRIRVRVGPFASRAEAEKAADKIKKLDLPAIILTL